MSAPLSRGASRDLALALRSLRATRTHVLRIGWSQRLDAEQRREVEAARDDLTAIERNLMAVEMKGGGR